MRNFGLFTTVLAGIALAASGASAQMMEHTVTQTTTEYAPIDSQGSGAIPALPLQVMTNGSITYINGGIGDEELAELKSKKHDFNLRLLLTGSSGEFVSDVSLRITDESGTQILAIDDAGPYTYVLLPKGTYTLDASSVRDTTIKRMKFTIPASGSINKQINFAEPGGVTTVHQPTATND